MPNSDSTPLRKPTFNMKRKNPAAVSLGRKGGKAGSGAAKARSSEAARAAVLQRWKNHRAKTGKPDQTNLPTTGDEAPF